MLDWLNFRFGEIIGLIHALEKRYYQNKTQLRYYFGSVYISFSNADICISDTSICNECVKTQPLDIEK